MADEDFIPSSQDDETEMKMDPDTTFVNEDSPAESVGLSTIARPSVLLTMRCSNPALPLATDQIDQKSSYRKVNGIQGYRVRVLQPGERDLRNKENMPV